MKYSRKPDFENLLNVLKKDKPERATLFEFYLNPHIHNLLTEGEEIIKDDLYDLRKTIKAYENAGYDYCTLHASDFRFKSNRDQHGKSSLSLNESAIITDWESYELYKWNNPEDYDYSRLEKLKSSLPEGMKFIVYGEGGVLENVVELLGYENLCYLLADDPHLVEKIFDDVGSRLLKYYEISLQYDSVGAVISNDDWGFNTQPFLRIEDMERYVFKWHRKIVKKIHEAGRPAILHSCGELKDIMDTIIYDIGYDGKHSYEDNILPVEEAYELYGGKIAILGGIDMNFLCTKTPEEVYKRSYEMVERTMERGGYALGSGNSIPEYTPPENYFAMIKAVHDFR